MKASPGVSMTLPSRNLPTRIFGPCRSTMMPTARSTLRQVSRTSSARRMWSSAVPWEKFRRTTSTPARNIRSSTAASLEAGPSVATILVLLTMPSCGAAFEDLDRGQLVPLEEFQEGTPAGGDVADAIAHAVLGDRGKGVAAAGDRERVRGGDGFRERARAVLEPRELEHAHGAVP